MRARLKLNNNTWSFNVKDRSVSTGDKEIHFSISLEPDKFEVTLNNKLYSGYFYLEKVTGKLHLVINGYYFRFNILSQATDSTSVSGRDTVTSQLPGRVIDLFVSKGEKVEPGQKLLVLEAMKMEHTLKSEIAAIVKEIFIKPGDTTSADQVLIGLKASDGKDSDR